MVVASTVAACIAAIAATAGIVVARRGARRRRLTEVADIVDEIRVNAEWGSGAMLKREEGQRRLQARLKGLDLPRVRELAASRETSEETVPLARAAYDEVMAELQARGGRTMLSRTC